MYDKVFDVDANNQSNSQKGRFHASSIRQGRGAMPTAWLSIYVVYVVAGKKGKTVPSVVWYGFESTADKQETNAQCLNIFSNPS